MLKSIIPFLSSFFLAAFAVADVINFQVGAAGSCYQVECNDVQGFDFRFGGGGYGISNDGNTLVNQNASGGIAFVFGQEFESLQDPFVTMTRTNGGLFALRSIDAALGAIGFGDTSVRVTGITALDEVIVQTFFDVDSWESYALSNFDAVRFVAFETFNVDAGFSIDDLVVDLLGTPIPIGSTLWLALLGWFACIRRRGL